MFTGLGEVLFISLMDYLGEIENTWETLPTLLLVSQIFLLVELINF
jgi:hypothetical protein